MLAECQETKQERKLDLRSRLLCLSKRLLANARVASQASEFFVKTVQLQYPGRRGALCSHGQPSLKKSSMTQTGQLRFISAFYQTWRYSLVLPQTSRPADLCLAQLSFDIYFPMLQLAIWSRMLEYEQLSGLYHILAPSSKGWNREPRDCTHPWQKVCRCILAGRRSVPIRFEIGSRCWSSFFQECQLSCEKHPGFFWPPSKTTRD